MDESGPHDQSVINGWVILDHQTVEDRTKSAQTGLVGHAVV